MRTEDQSKATYIASISFGPTCLNQPHNSKPYTLSLHCRCPALQRLQPGHPSCSSPDPTVTRCIRFCTTAGQEGVIRKHLLKKKTNKTKPTTNQKTLFLCNHVAGLLFLLFFQVCAEQPGWLTELPISHSTGNAESSYGEPI